MRPNMVIWVMFNRTVQFCGFFFILPSSANQCFVFWKRIAHDKPTSTVVDCSSLSENVSLNKCHIIISCCNYSILFLARFLPFSRFLSAYFLSLVCFFLILLLLFQAFKISCALKPKVSRITSCYIAFVMTIVIILPFTPFRIFYQKYFLYKVLLFLTTFQGPNPKVNLKENLIWKWYPCPCIVVHWPVSVKSYVYVP